MLQFLLVLLLTHGQLLLVLLPTLG